MPNLWQLCWMSSNIALDARTETVVAIAKRPGDSVVGLWANRKSMKKITLT